MTPTTHVYAIHDELNKKDPCIFNIELSSGSGGSTPSNKMEWNEGTPHRRACDAPESFEGLNIYDVLAERAAAELQVSSKASSRIPYLTVDVSRAEQIYVRIRRREK